MKAYIIKTHYSECESLIKHVEIAYQLKAMKSELKEQFYTSICNNVRESLNTNNVIMLSIGVNNQNMEQKIVKISEFDKEYVEGNYFDVSEDENGMYIEY